MKRILLAAVVVVVTAGCGATDGDGTGVGGGGAPTCAAPWIDGIPSMQPGDTAPTPTVAVGGSITLYGHAYFADCHDTGQEGAPAPIDRVDPVVELPGGKRIRVDPVHPDANGTFSFTLDVPEGTEPGDGRVFDQIGSPLGHSFTVTDE